MIDNFNENNIKKQSSTIFNQIRTNQTALHAIMTKALRAIKNKSKLEENERKLFFLFRQRKETTRTQDKRYTRDDEWNEQQNGDK